VFLVFASICNAIMDVCQHHFDKSIFKREGKDKWNRWHNARHSWRNKYVNGDPKQGRRKLKIKGTPITFNYPVQLSDGWHYYKMLMLVFMCLAILNFPKPFEFKIFDSWIVNGIAWLGILGLIWNQTFSLFYEHFLIKKEEN